MVQLTVEQAVEQILQHTNRIRETKEMELLQVRGRILACDMRAAFDNPPFDRSPVDGYACRASDTKGASKEYPAVLKVTAEVDAGQYLDREIQKGEAVRIMTGAAIPRGCDCCIYQENTDYGEEQVLVYKEMKAWENYCVHGEDFHKGDLLLAEGTKLGFVEIGVLAAMGLASVPVYRRPRAALLVSGDEVTAPGGELLPGKIYNSNQALLAARLLDLGVELVCTRMVPDDVEEMGALLKEAAKTADFIVTTGAVSVGKKDIMHDALDFIGARRIFWKIQMKPGMPTLFSVYQNVPILSLSGNPFGVAVGMEILLRPMLEKMAQDHTLGLVHKRGILKNSLNKAVKGRRFVRAIWEDGTIRLPDGLHSNGILASMAGCNCLIDAKPDGQKLLAGAEAEVVLL